MKPLKAAGHYVTLAEFTKNGDLTLKQYIFKVIVKKQENKLVKLSEGILCPVHRKRDRTRCNNYRRISLLDITYTIFAILLYN